MSKIDNLGTLASLENQTSAIQTINENSDKIEAAFENTLSRDGSGPNHMEAHIDMNGYRLLNLPAPREAHDPVRWGDIATLEIIVNGVLIPPQVGNEGKILTTTGTILLWQTPSEIPGLGDLKASNNLSDVQDTPTARDNLGLGSASTANISDIGLLGASQTWTANQTFSGASNFVTGDLVLTGTPASEFSAGFRGSPPVVKTDNATLLVSESGKTIVYEQSIARTFTIPQGVLHNGGFFSLINLGSAAVTIARAAGVSLRLIGSSDNINRSVAANGMITIWQRSPNNWVCWGSGVS